MVNLLSNCNLAISFDTKNNTLLMSGDIVSEQPQTVSLLSLLPTLLNKSLSYPEQVYNEYNTLYSNDDDFLSESEVSFDLIYLPAGLLGIEYIKSHIYYTPTSSTPGMYTTIIEVLYGKVTVILQKNQTPQDEFEFDTSVEEAFFVNIKEGQKCAIPKGYFFTFINTGETPAIFVKINKESSHADYNLLKREGGLAYYCIRKNARTEIVLNPRYRKAPEIRKIKPDYFLSKLNLNWTRPLYEILKEEKQILSEVLCTRCS